MKRSINNIKKCLLCTAVSLALIGSMGGCFGRNDNARGAELDHIGYTFEEIDAMAISNNNLDDVTDIDRTDDALHAYNQMLGYLDNTLGVDYKIHYYFHVDYNGTDGGYVMSIVLDEDVESVEAEGESYRVDERVIQLSTDENGNNLDSGAVPCMMAKKWTEDVYTAVSKKIPESHMNTFYVGLYNITSEVKNQNYTDFYDYYYYYDLDTYNGDGYFRYDNSINIILPPETAADDAESIYEDIRPTLEKYCVTQVTLLCPTDDKAFETLKTEENISGNYYLANPNKGVEWVERFDIRE